MKWTVEHDGETYELKIGEFEIEILREGNRVAGVSDIPGGVGWPWQLKDLRDAFEDKIKRASEERNATWTAFSWDGKNKFWDALASVIADNITEARERIAEELLKTESRFYYDRWLESGMAVGRTDADGSIIGRVERER